MKWSWKLGEIRGISINVHATFLIFLGWIAVGQLQGNPRSAVAEVFFSLAVFGTIILHELGHALAAARYGIPTRDITLWPIGGVARLERMPREPKQELVVALAGPAVNVALMGVLGIVGNFIALFFAQYPLGVTAGGLVSRLIWVNGFLALFNLLPAFPMDGGRVLRAFLAMRMQYVQATGIAASTGRMMSVLFGFAGLLVFEHPMLVLIALFVWSAAGSEEKMTRMREKYGYSDQPFSSTKNGGATVHNAFRTLRYQVSNDEVVEDAEYWEEGKKKKFRWSFFKGMFPDLDHKSTKERENNHNIHKDHTVRMVFR